MPYVTAGGIWSASDASSVAAHSIGCGVIPATAVERKNDATKSCSLQPEGQAVARCPSCKARMQQVQSRYEPREGRLIQSFAEYACDCGVKLMVSDLKTTSATEVRFAQPDSGPVPT